MRKLSTAHLQAVICNEYVRFVEPVTLCKKVAYYKDVIVCMIDSRETYLG